MKLLFHCQFATVRGLHTCTLKLWKVHVQVKLVKLKNAPRVPEAVSMGKVRVGVVWPGESGREAVGCILDTTLAMSWAEKMEGRYEKKYVLLGMRESDSGSHDRGRVCGRREGSSVTPGMRGAKIFVE